MLQKTDDFLLWSNTSGSGTLIFLFAECTDALLARFERIGVPVYILAFKDPDWGRDFSPWPYERFQGKGKETIDRFLKQAEPFKDRTDKIYCLGYSLGGLLSLYACSLYPFIDGFGSASGSLWYPGLIEFLKDNPIREKRIYLSLGDKEHKGGNSLMRSVKAKTEEVKTSLEKENDLFFEWNKGNHFQDVDIRITKALGYLLKEVR